MIIPPLRRISILAPRGTAAAPVAAVSPRGLAAAVPLPKNARRRRRPPAPVRRRRMVLRGAPSPGKMVMSPPSHLRGSLRWGAVGGRAAVVVVGVVGMSAARVRSASRARRRWNALRPMLARMLHRAFFL